MARQVERHRGPARDFGIDANLPAGLAHEAVDHRQAEARALPYRLGRVERVERARDHLGPHADAAVADRQRHIRPRLGIALARGGLVEPAVGGLDRERAAVRHGVARVDAQVQQRVFELAGVDARRPQVRRADHPHRDLRPHGAADQFLHLADQPVDVGRARVERLPARKREQAVGQRRRARRAILRGLQEALDIVEPPLREALAHAVERAGDRLQQIVEIMRDAAGELADRLHLVRLAQRLLGLDELARALLDPRLQQRVDVGEGGGDVLLVLDVGVGAGPAADAPGAVAHRRAAPDVPAIGAVVTAKPEFRRVGLARRGGLLETRARLRDVLGMQHRRPAFARKLLRRRARVAVDLLVVPLDLASRIGEPELVGYGLREGAEPRLAFAQFLGGAHRVGDVDAFDENAGDLPGLALDRLIDEIEIVSLFRVALAASQRERLRAAAERFAGGVDVVEQVDETLTDRLGHSLRRRACRERSERPISF